MTEITDISGFESEQTKTKVDAKLRHAAWFEASGALSLTVVGGIVGYAPQVTHRGVLLSLFFLTAVLLVGAVYTYWAKHQIEIEVRETASTIPQAATIDRLRLVDQVRTLEHHRKSLQAWGVLQQFANQEVLNFVRQINTKRANPAALANQPLPEILAGIRTEFETIVNRIMQRMADNRFDLFGFVDQGEVYFFDIFELRGDELHLVGRSKHPNATEHRRSWRIGEGHIGTTVQRRKTVLINYDRDPRRDLDDQKRDTDEKQFRCRIVAPIFSADERPHGAHGAICVSSNVGSRLLDDHTPLCANLALSLLALFYAKEVVEKRLTSNMQPLHSGASS